MVTYENYHSYGRPGKIIYHPCSKYKLSTCSLWSFTAITPFKERASRAFVEQPEKYKSTSQKQYNGHSSRRTSHITTDEPGKTG